MISNGIKSIKNSLKKIYRTFRISRGAHSFKPSRLVISKCKWKDNADSPVVFMIDDLTNAWFDKNQNGRMDVGEDWGAGKYSSNSALTFLARNLFCFFPHIKTTFFLVVGRMAPFRKHCDFTHSGKINENNDIINFFRSLYFDYRFELAYHGLDHGTSGNADRTFTQEWLTFSNLDEAIDQIEKGLKIFRRTFGSNPNGGKYGGYKYNDFSDKSVDLSNFKWWCRDWYPWEISNNENTELFELGFFGANKVVDIPSNVHGFWWSKKSISSLIANNQIISIQEHIAPYRVDGKIQNPNIIDDIRQLKGLFNYLQTKNVWHATCTEVANYFIGYTDSLIYDVTNASFRVKYWGRSDNSVISLIVDARSICSPDRPFIEIVLPNDCVLSRYHYRYDKENFIHLVSIPVISGLYKVHAVDRPASKLEAKIGKNGAINYNYDLMSGSVDLELRDRNVYYIINSKSNMKQPLEKKTGDVFTYLCLNSSEKVHLEELQKVK